MKSPLEYASRCLFDIEDRWIPYSALWWRIWTPRIGRDERYLESHFQGYPADDDVDISNMSAIDIRRMLAMPFVRKLYKKLPYIDVMPVRRPWEDMSEVEQKEREKFVIDSTMAEYGKGRALYPRETIMAIEEQLQAAEERTLRRNRRGRGPLHRLKRRLCEGCEAPQMTWVKFKAFDGVVQYTTTYAPKAKQALYASSEEEVNAVYMPGRSQIEFRSIQELTMPDPDAFNYQFMPDGWQRCVAYNPIYVVPRAVNESLINTFFGVEEGQMTRAELSEAFDRGRAAVGASPEWKVFEDEARTRPTVKSIDNIVFFYMSGLAENNDDNKCAMTLFALVSRIRELAQGPSDKPRRPIPIYMPTHKSTRRWDEAEREFLCQNGVILVESNGQLFLKVDERTAVVSYMDQNPVKQVVADLAKPAMLICNTVSEDPDQDFVWVEEERDGETVKVPNVRANDFSHEAVMNDPDSPRVRKLVADYDKLELPELLRSTEDSDQQKTMSMYVRRVGVCTNVDYW